MAGDWIKMRLDLQTHPKVVRILSATKSDKFRAIGGLHAVWSVFDTHSVDGRLAGYTPETLDHVIGWAGFAEAMIAVDWLACDGEEALILPEFDEHNGKSGKRRAEDQKRKRNERSSPQSVRNLSENEADKKLTREEKRREDIEPKETTSSSDDDRLACPVQSIINLYHECMPDNPTVKTVNKSREGAIKQRWREAAKLTCKPFGYSSREDGLASWRRFFEICAQSDFLTGKVRPRPGMSPFIADIDFLFSPTGFAKTLENKYHREAA